MIKPNPIVVDGNLVLSSASAAIIGNMQDRDILHNADHENPMYRGRGIIIKSFLNTMFSNVKQMSKMKYEPTHFCIVWDKRINGKYHKSNIIDQLGDGEGYKGDRTYVSVEDLDNPEVLESIKESLKKENKGMRPSDAALTQMAKDRINADLIRTRERYAARDFIESELAPFGMASYYLAGWEADDLDLLWAIETEKRGGMQIHYSGDSDWSVHLRDRDIHWQVNRSKLHLKDVAKVRTKFGIPDHLSLMEWAELQYSAFGSHNFLKRTFDPSIKRVTKKYKDQLFTGDLSNIVDMERFEVQRKCFDIPNFPEADKALEIYDTMLSTGITASPADFKELLVKMSIGDRDKHGMYNSYNGFTKILLDSKLKQI